MNAAFTTVTAPAAAAERGRKIVYTTAVLVATTARGRLIGWIEIPAVPARAAEFRSWAAGQGAKKFTRRVVPTGPLGPQVA